MNLKRMILSACCLFLIGFTAKANERLLFSYFTGNGEDGLHFAASEDGLNWTALNGGHSFLHPYIGESKLMRDPCVLLGPDQRFHLVWTTGWGGHGIGIAHSSDLIHWSAERNIPVMDHEPEARNCWAPEIFYDEESKQYVIFWATTIPGRFTETSGSSETDYNHRIYCTTTRDFETYSDTRVFYDDGFNVIDSTIFKRGPHDFVMFLKNETLKPPEKNIRMAFSKSPLGPWSSSTPPISGEDWAEGPTAIRIGEYCYVYFDKYRKGEYGAVRSRDFENWEDVSNQLHVPEGLRHGTVFRVPSSIWKAMPR
ncbi:MAG: family 43 glycosylhydrolase [bacterium]|nr:family 43 glycosylhydrolase [bacterium]